MFDMLFLAEFTVLRPNLGLIFWTTVIFLLFWFLMAKFAFGPIKDALKKRDGDIADALAEAQKAKEEMASLNAKNEALLAEAREERSKMMKEAKETKDQIIAEAKQKANEEAKRIVNNAKAEIDTQKTAAMLEVKNQAGMMAISIAEKIIRKELKGNPEQESFANALVDEMNLN